MTDKIRFVHAAEKDVSTEIAGTNDMLFFRFADASVDEDKIVRLFYDMMCTRPDICAVFTNAGVLVDCSKVKDFSADFDVWSALYYHCVDSGFVCIKDIYV
jgi:hypothetical protein